MKNVEIFTDGSCLGNPGIGGYGAVLKYNDHIKEISGGEQSTTNNRMEMTALLLALKELKESCKVMVTSDSKYVIDALQKGWAENWQKNNWKKSDKKPALNNDLWEQLLTETKKHDISYIWTKGHAGHEYNERCDTLAVEFANKIKNTK